MGRFDRIIEIEKRHDELEEIEKFNPYHDRAGRFSSANGGGAGIAGGAAAGAQREFKKIDHAEAVAMAKSMGQDPRDMDDDDVENILRHLNDSGTKAEGYIGTANSFKINRKLRQDVPVESMSEADQKTIEALDRNMKPSPSDIVLYRMIGNSLFETLGIGDIDAMDWEDKKEQAKMMQAIGKVYPNKGYTSTSFQMDDNVFDTRSVQMIIKAPKGTKMLVSPDRDYGEISEAEIVLARNSAMKITNIAPRIENGFLHGVTVEAEVLLD